MLLSWALRRSWRANKPVQVVLHSFQETKTGVAWSARSFTSADAAGGGGLLSSVAKGAKPTTEGNLHWKSVTRGEKIIPVLRAYKEIYGDVNVPQNFVVPSGDAHWPRAAWGCRLGNRVNRLRSRAGKQALSPSMMA
jgi:hypothetical protein